MSETIVEHVHELLTEPENPADLGRRAGVLCVAIRLPEGETLMQTSSIARGGAWQTPTVSPKMPEGLGRVEYYVDGVHVSSGIWPNLEPVG